MSTDFDKLPLGTIDSDLAPDTIERRQCELQQPLSRQTFNDRSGRPAAREGRRSMTGLLRNLPFNLQSLERPDWVACGQRGIVRHMAASRCSTAVGMARSFSSPH